MNLIDAAVIPDSLTDTHSGRSRLNPPCCPPSRSPGSVSGRCGCLGVPVRVLSVPECVPKSRLKTQKPQRRSNRPPTVSCLEFQSSRRSLIGRAVSLASYWLEPHCGGLWSMEFTVVIAESKTVFPQIFTSYNSPGVTS